MPLALTAVIAAEIEDHCGHRPFKCRRLDMGWTVAQAVAAAHQLVADEGLTKVGLSERSWKDWEAGVLPSPDYQDLLCRLFAANPVLLGFARDYSPMPADPLWNGTEASATLPAGQTIARGTSPAGTVEVAETKRRDAVKLAGLALAAPVAAAQVLQQAAAEAVEFTRKAGATSLGSGTLDHSSLAVTEFNHAYPLKPPKAVFGAVLGYRRKVDRFLRGGYTLPQGRELRAFAGWLSELLAWLAHDLGNVRTGVAFATDAFVQGQQAGHGQLCAWAMDAAASINLYEQWPAKAHEAAVKGLAEAPAGHSLTVRLQAQAVRAAASDDAEGFTAAFHAAYRLLVLRSPRRFGMDVLPLTSYPATSFIWLGQAEQARQHAEHARDL
ncbi:XRE family transcriptional regulator [Streptomyces ehimensis]|uniref:XRE family transcriptional regulator n=1 Tax=Streptomyces ehimensis TaxID=68195 RepID=A0ABV9BV28_9ACTN